MPKKTTEVIIKSKNDYVVAVKKNQPKLYELLEEKSKQQEALLLSVSQEKVKGRKVKRTVEVFNDLSLINQEYWRGVKCFIRVTREGERDGKAYYQRVYYLSSLFLSAEQFDKRIRKHWLIENQLHWVKDVVFSEDKSKIRSGNAPQNFSIIRSIAINLFKINGYTSVTQAQRMLADNINHLWLCLT